MEEKQYTAKEVAKMFKKEPKEITARVKKGGIKGVTVSETDDGFQYLLSDKAIDQLGALYGIAPNKDALVETRAKAMDMIDFDGQKAYDEFRKAGYQLTVISKAIGKADNYLTNSLKRNRISSESAEEIKRIFGVDVRKYEVHEQDAPTTDAPKAQSVDMKDIGETVRGAVYNGMIDAILMTLKEDTVRKMLIRIIADDEVQNIIQRIIFRALDGAIANREKNSTRTNMHAGLIPQNGVR